MVGELATARANSNVYRPDPVLLGLALERLYLIDDLPHIGTGAHDIDLMVMNSHDALEVMHADDPVTTTRMTKALDQMTTKLHAKFEEYDKDRKGYVKAPQCVQLAKWILHQYHPGGERARIKVTYEEDKSEESRAAIHRMSSLYKDGATVGCMTQLASDRVLKNRMSLSQLDRFMSCTMAAYDCIMIEEWAASTNAVQDELTELYGLYDDLFEMYDVDGNGVVDMDELMQMIAAIKHTQTSQLNQAKIMQLWDPNGDDEVGALDGYFMCYPALSHSTCTV